MTYNLYVPHRIDRPNLLRNPLLSQVLIMSNPLRLPALIGRFSPAKPNVSSEAFIVPRSPAVISKPNIEQVKPVYVRLAIIDEATYLDKEQKSEPITFDFTPNEITVSPTSNFVPIKILGANNPNYHYGGSEDTITFEVNWYGYAADPVIKKCRAIEALTKADGWAYDPPVVELLWDYSGRMFKDQQFIVVKAPYTMSNFSVSRRGYFEANTISERYNHGWPIKAVQTITLKRVSDQQTNWKEIRKY